MNKEYALVLEGGGAKGAYQIGAIKALLEDDYKFNTVIGTSIGAINAAFIAQGDIDKIENLWKTLSFKELMDINNDIIESILTKQINMKVIKELRVSLNKALKAKGIDTILMRNLLEEYLDEEKIRKSNIRFGLVTFCITDFKPQKLFIEDIPNGKLVDYLLASSNLPVFKRATVDEKIFLDGGAFDNCSVEMLYEAGYRNIMAIRLNQKNKIRNYATLSRKKDVRLKMIVPSIELPNTLDFQTKTLNELLKYGYIDTVKQLKRLDGNKYAFNKISPEEIRAYREKLTPIICLELVKELNIKYKPGENIVDIAYKKAIPKMNKYVSSKNSSNFKKQIINIVEYVARKEKISPNKVYDFNAFLLDVKSKAEQRKRLDSIDKAIYMFILNI